jgi:pilus assembly protein CpaE
MAQSDKEIVLISEDPQFTSRIGAIIGNQPGLSVRQCDASLSMMNGKAVELAKSSELIIFKAMPDVMGDVEALRTLVDSGGSARILAVSDSSVPFGVAHGLLRAGVSEIVPDTIEDAELARVVSCLSMPRRLTLTPQDHREGQVIVVSKARGGVGATTLAVNLADQLCGRKKRLGRSETRKVVLVDLDLQFGAVAGFLIFPRTRRFTLLRATVSNRTASFCSNRSRPRNRAWPCWRRPATSCH